MEKSLANKSGINKRAFAAAKAHVLCLNVAALLCGSCIITMLASIPYTYFLDAQEEAKPEAIGGGSNYDPEWSYNGKAVWGCVFLLGPLGIVTYSVGHRRRKSIAVVRQMAYANIADLPAPESLVRAFSEPTQAKQVVLLRAAAEGHETPAEELVRASVSFSATRSRRPG